MNTEDRIQLRKQLILDTQDAIEVWRFLRSHGETYLMDALAESMIEAGIELSTDDAKEVLDYYMKHLQKKGFIRVVDDESKGMLH